MNEPSQPRDPMAEALEWVSRIVAASLFMVGPLLLVRMWEGRAGIWTMIAGAFGLFGGLAYLILITSSRRKD